MLRSFGPWIPPWERSGTPLPAGGFSVKCRPGLQTRTSLNAFSRDRPARTGPGIHSCPHRAEGYPIPRASEWVKWAVETLKCPVIASGNIVDTQTAEAWVRLAAPAGLMAGRTALQSVDFFPAARPLPGKPHRPPRSGTSSATSAACTNTRWKCRTITWRKNTSTG